jgi:hypothetical protein
VSDVTHGPLVKTFHGKFAKHKHHVGHSAHVTNIRWSTDNKLLVSAGGADTAALDEDDGVAV